MRTIIVIYSYLPTWRLHVYGLELHRNRDEIADILDPSTLVARIRVADTHQIQRHLQDGSGAAWRRAYLKTAQGVVLAVWLRDADGALRYVARSPHYDSQWQLPHVADDDLAIAVGVWRTDAATKQQAQAWAERQMVAGKIATAVMVDRGEIRAAWELVDGRAQIVAFGPRGLA